MTDDILIVAALLRKEGQILLVRQQGPGDAHPDWALPGGVAEPGELLVEALAREVREETGIEVLRVGELISVAQTHNPSGAGWSRGELPQPGGRATAFVFEVAEWKGELSVGNPDEFVLEARFWPRNEAMERLEGHPSRPKREPILAHLQGEVRDRVWLYRRDEAGQEELVWPSRAEAPEANEQLRRARALVVLGCLVVLAILVVIVIIGVITLARPFA